MAVNAATDPMKVALLSPHDFKGGASRIAYYLFRLLEQDGQDVRFYSGIKSINHDRIIPLKKKMSPAERLMNRGIKWLDRELGRESFYYPQSRSLFADQQWVPDIIHSHNLQGGYFDLRLLPELSTTYPFLLTLHDPWMFSGHCSYFIECQRWKQGCGNCPDLLRQPSLKRDGTAGNWRRKKDIYDRSQLYVATPSKWLHDEMLDSMLAPNVRLSRVINNGVDTSVFFPADRQEARKKLSLPEDALILLYVVNSNMKNNPYKDFETVATALEHLEKDYTGGKKLCFIGLGGHEEVINKGNLTQIFVPHQNDLPTIAAYFQAADLYLHAARAENYPNVVMEALSCGTPVVATTVGGVGEQILDGETGRLVPYRNGKAMADAVRELIGDPAKLREMGAAASAWIKQNHTLECMYREYKEFYSEIQEDFNLLK